MKLIFYSLAIVSLLLINACKKNSSITIRIKNETKDSINNRLFGHFLEKPSWGNEFGIESALRPGTHQLQDGVFEKMDSMEIPILRFPGGTDVDHLDWTDMIDNAPEHEGGRPLSTGHTGVEISNYFGYDEALQLAERLGSEMILVVNFGDGYYGRKSLEKAANHAAALVAYCNSPVGADLPGTLEQWPEIRKLNGREVPYNVKYFQIANEPWVLDRRLKNTGNIDDSLKNHYFTCLDAYISAMTQADPEIKLILDANSHELAAELKDRYGNRIHYAAYHMYYPWQISEIDKNGTSVDSLSDEKVWNAWVALPRFDDQGLSILDSSSFLAAISADYPIAVTEWNWNGWWSEKYRKKGLLDSDWAKGLGAAGILHAMMRKGSKIALGCQSMLAGNSWGISGIRVDPEGNHPAKFLPTGYITAFYSNFHGNILLKTEGENIPFYQQPYRMSGILPADKVSVLDFLSTGDDNFIYLHLINREFNADIPVIIDITDFKNEFISGTHYYLKGNLKNNPFNSEIEESFNQFNRTVTSDNGKIELTIPKRSVNVIKIKI